MTSLAPDLELLGQTVVVIGGSSGIGLATARLARAGVPTWCSPPVMTASCNRSPVRWRAQFAAFDIADFDRLQRFFDELEGSVDHVLVTGPGPYYSSIADMDFALARQQVGDRLLTPLAVGRAAAPKMPARGSLAFMGGTGGRSAGIGKTLISALSVGLQSLVASMAVELAPSA